MHAVSTEVDLLNQIGPPLNHLRNFIHNDENMGPYSVRENRGEGRLNCSPGNIVRWSDRAVTEAIAGLIITTAGWVADQPPSLDEEPAIAGLLESHIETPVAKDALPFITIRILSAAEKIRSLRKFSVDIMPRLDEVADTPARQFTLMKLLAKPVSVDDKGDMAQLTRSLQSIYTFTQLDPLVNSQPPVRAHLEAGKFDSFLAEEVIEDAKETEPDSGPGLVELQKQMRLIEMLFHPDSEFMHTILAQLSTPDAVQLWPEVSKRELASRAARYVQSLKDVSAKRRNHLSNYSCIVANSSEEDVRHAAHGLALTLSDQVRTNTRLSASQRLAAGGKPLERKRRHRLGKQSSKGAGESEASPATAAEVQQNPKKLVYITTRGQEMDEDSAEYRALFDDYIEAHRDQQTLPGDLSKVQTYLRTIDFSSGLPRGVKKLPVSNIKRGSTTLKKVYQFIPAYAVGLSTQSEIASKTVVMFTLSKEQVGIIAVDDITQIARIRKRFGLRGKHRH